MVITSGGTAGGTETGAHLLAPRYTTTGDRIPSNGTADAPTAARRRLRRRRC